MKPLPRKVVPAKAGSLPATISPLEQQLENEREKKRQTRDAIVACWNKPYGAAYFRQLYPQAQLRDVTALIDRLKLEEATTIDQHGSSRLGVDDDTLSLLRAASKITGYEGDGCKSWRAAEGRAALIRTILPSTQKQHWTDAVASSISGVGVSTLENWRTSLRKQLSVKDLSSCTPEALSTAIDSLRIGSYGRVPTFSDAELGLFVGIANQDAQAANGHTRRQLGALGRKIAKDAAAELPPGPEKDRLQKLQCGPTWMNRTVNVAASVAGGEWAQFGTTYDRLRSFLLSSKPRRACKCLGTLHIVLLMR